MKGCQVPPGSIGDGCLISDHSIDHISDHCIDHIGDDRQEVMEAQTKYHLFTPVYT